jgi:hypothetical protein
MRYTISRRQGTPVYPTIFSVIISLVVLTGCGTTSELQNHWFDPSTDAHYANYKKVLVAAFVNTETGRRAAETELVEALGRRNSVASYKHDVSSDVMKTGENAKIELIDKGFDAALVLRFVEKEKDQRWMPGFMGNGFSPAWGFGPMWGWGWSMWHDPGMAIVDKTYYYETNLYDLKTDKLIWSGITSTMNPISFNSKIKSIAQAVTEQMRKDGIF